MSLSDPRAIADFVDLLRITSVVWRSQRNDEISGQGSGQTWTAELAPPLWGADVTVDILDMTEARQVRAMINSLSGPGKSFYLYDPIGKYPASDPDGSILGSSTVLIDTIGGDNTSVKLSGLPAGYTLGPGDYFHVDYGSNPTRRALFEVSETGIASGAGLTGLFAIYPHIQTGITTTMEVTLIKPAAKVIIVPGSINPGTEQGVTVSGIAFTAIQKL
jgi:hypothetical protein